MSGTKIRIVSSKSKSTVLNWARNNNRKVLWKDAKGRWYAATDRANTPKHAVETEDVT